MSPQPAQIVQIGRTTEGHVGTMSHCCSLEISEREPGETRVLVRGEVDLAAAPSLLDSVLCIALSHDAGHRIVIDLGEVSFLDSTGLATLHEAHRRIEAQDQHLVIEHVTPPVRRVMEIAGVLQVLRIGEVTPGVDA